ncbi:MAG: WD40 repeat domain-containing protein, partial [Gemmataceae bacterium]
MRRFLIATMGCVLIVSGQAVPQNEGEKNPSGRKNLPQGAVLRLGDLRLSQGGPVTGLAFKRDGKILYSSGKDSPLRAWDTTSGEEMPAPGNWTGPCSAIASSQDRRILAAAGEEAIQLFDLDQEKTLTSVPIPSGKSCVGMSFSPNGKILAWIDSAQQLHL